MITVRRAIADDASALAEISNEVHAMHVVGHPSAFKARDDVFTLDRMRSLIVSDQHLVWVAVIDETIVGFAHAIASDEPDMPWRAATRVLELKAMGVTASRRGHGIGTRLLDAVLDAARERNAHEVRLTVWGFNDDARRFYRRHGFSLRTEQLERVVENDGGNTVP